MYEVREQDRLLPIANVARTMKSALPPQAKLSMDSKRCMQECVSEFIMFITSQALDQSNEVGRKTVTGEDVLLAMSLLGFEAYAEACRIYLAKFRQFEQDQAIQKTNKVRCRPKECRAEFQLGSFQVNGDEMGVRYPQISDPSDLSDRETEKYIESDNSLDVSSEPTNDNFLILQLTTILN